MLWMKCLRISFGWIHGGVWMCWIGRGGVWSLRIPTLLVVEGVQVVGVHVEVGIRVRVVIAIVDG